MQETKILDTLSQLTGQSVNFILFVILCVIGLSIVLWFIVCTKRKKKQKEIVKPIIRTVTPDIKKENTTKKKTPEAKEVVKVEQVKKIDSKVESKAEPKIVVPPPQPEQLSEPSKPKHIGYTPINLLEQTEPLKFPYVIMPKPSCVIKFPQKGRSSRKGYKEDDFKTYLTKYFKNSFELFDDRFILVKGSNNPYEPDFSLIDEKAGINIFLDVEIDEPYEGINNIEKRKATHFRFTDTNRNNAIKNRGWIVIRFAEIQVHQNPNSCCLFIADVIANIHSQFKFPTELLSINRITSIPQWTKEEAEKMSREKYRERYLGIDSFGLVAENSKITAIETELGKKTEDIVKDEAPIIIPATVQPSINPNQDLVITAINNNHFISFIYFGTPTIVKPNTYRNGILNAYCYIKNSKLNFTVANILNPVIKQRPFTLEVTGPNLGIDRIVSVVNTAIQYHKFIRMNYTRSAWTSRQVDQSTGEIITDFTDAEESTRTINNVQLAIDALDQHTLRRYNLNKNYITAYCNKREEQRTFRFDRISELAILDL